MNVTFLLDQKENQVALLINCTIVPFQIQLFTPATCVLFPHNIVYIWFVVSPTVVCLVFSFSQETVLTIQLTAWSEVCQPLYWRLSKQCCWQHTDIMNDGGAMLHWEDNSTSGIYLNSIMWYVMSYTAFALLDDILLSGPLSVALVLSGSFQSLHLDWF